MNIKNLTVPTLIGLSLLFGACAEQQIETPDASGIQEGIEGIEQSAEDANDALSDGVKELQKGAEDATGALQNGMDNIQQSAEDATGAANKAVKDLGDKIPPTNSN
ncbi:MAG: hypothetical protein ACFCU5_17060 [Pleurocapsa sp.]